MSDFWTRFDQMKADALATDDGKAFAAAGFEFYHNGGGLTAWRKVFEDGRHIMVTSSEGNNHCPEDDDESYLIGFYASDDDTDPGCSKGHKTAAQVLVAVERGPLDKIGVDVWIAGTIYVDAADHTEAAKIVADSYAGTLTNAYCVHLREGEGISVGEGDDFLSSALTLYGVCDGAVLLPVNDPVRDAASDMLAALKAIKEARGNCGFSPFEQRAYAMMDAAIAKAEGRANG